MLLQEAFGKMMLDLFFTDYDIDAILGTTPDGNKLALRYAQRVGMSLHGPIPNYATWKGELTDGWISHISKIQWAERRKPVT